MYFYQVLQSCDEFKVVSEFLAIIKCQDKCSVNKNIRDALKTLSQKTPKKSDNEVLFIEQLKDRQDEGENLYNVYTTFIYSIDQIKKTTVSRQFLGMRS